MRNYLFNKTFNSLSKSFYGVDATYAQSLQALWMIAVLILMCVINASASASLILVFFRQKPEGFIFYLFVLVMLGVILGSLSNLLSSSRKKMSFWYIINTNMGAFYLLYFILIFSSVGVVLKINYANAYNSIDDLINIYNKKATSDWYLVFFIILVQGSFIFFVLIQIRRVIDSFKVKQYDNVYAYIFKDLNTLKKSNNSTLGKFDFIGSGVNNEQILIELKGKRNGLANDTLPEIDLMNAVLSRDQEREKKREIEEAKTKIKYLEEQVSAQVTIIKAVEHELANSLLPASRGFKHITDFLEENYSGILNEKILSSSPQSISVGALNKIVGKNLEYSYEILNSISEVVICDPNQMDKRKLNFQEFVKSEYSSFDFDKISVQLEFSGDATCDIYLDEKQFRIFLKNLFKNAKMHGFHKKHNGTILFKIQKNDSDVSIEMFNDGNRFPEGFNSDYFFRPLKKYGETGNKGIGGFLMNLVVQNHGGVLTLSDCSNTKSDFNVCFTIKLPLKNIANESIN